MKSLRQELTVWLVGGVVATCLLAGWLLWVLVCAKSRDDFDAALLARASALASLLKRDSASVEFDFHAPVMPEFHRDEDPEYFQIWILGQDSLDRSRSLGLGDLPRRVGPLDLPEFFDLDLPDGRRGRAVGMTTIIDFEHEAQPMFALSDLRAETVLAASTASLQQSNAAILRMLLACGGFLLLAATTIVTFAIRRCTRRLRDFTDQLAGIGTESLDVRLDANPVVAELRPLVETTNTLLQRLKNGFDRERRMTSNIAHELRTPVAELRTAADVASRWPDDPELTAEALEVAAKVSVRMTSIITSLLRLGRLQSGHESLEITELDLESVAHEVATELDQEAIQHGCRIEHRSNGKAMVSADEPLTRVLVQNLLRNAVDHAPSGSRIICEWRRAKSVLRWRVKNPASGLSQSDMRFLSEPFWRKDEARSGDLHQGLGLALCQAICAAQGWNLKFRFAGGELHASVFVRCPPS